MAVEILDILIIVAEVSLIILAFSVFHWLIGKLFKQLVKLAWLGKGDRSTRSLRRKIRRMLILHCLLLCALVIGVNAWLIYQGNNLQEYTLEVITPISPDFWKKFAIGAFQSAGIVILALIGQAIVYPILDIACNRAKKFEYITSNDQSIEEFFGFLKNNLTYIVWLSVAIGCTQFLQVPATVPKFLYIGLRIYVIIAAGLLIFKAVAAIIDSLDALSNKYSNPDNLLRFYDHLRHLVSFLKRSLEYVIYVYMATLVVQQLELVADFAAYGPRIARVIGIIFISRIFVEVANLVIEETLLKNKKLTDFEKQRRLTLIPLIRSSLRYAIYFGASISVLYTLGIDPTPIVAAAGIVGLAIGLGAQNLINDMVSGFFILFENYYLVGDFVEVGKAMGIVEAIDLRATRIRNPDGQQHIIRNGDIGELINYSKEYTNAVVEVGVAYQSDLDHVYRVIEEIGKVLKQEQSVVIQPTRVDGLNEFGESDLVVRTVTKVKPGTHLRIERILRKMIKDTFDREGIEIPFARRVLIFQPEDGGNRDVVNAIKGNNLD